MNLSQVLLAALQLFRREHGCLRMERHCQLDNKVTSAESETAPDRPSNKLMCMRLCVHTTGKVAFPIGSPRPIWLRSPLAGVHSKIYVVLCLTFDLGLDNQIGIQPDLKNQCGIQPDLDRHSLIDIRNMTEIALRGIAQLSSTDLGCPAHFSNEHIRVETLASRDPCVLYVLVPLVTQSSTATGRQTHVRALRQLSCR